MTVDLPVEVDELVKLDIMQFGLDDLSVSTQCDVAILLRNKIHTLIRCIKPLIKVNIMIKVNITI